MDLSQFVTQAQKRHRAEADSNWTEGEILGLLSNRINESLTWMGLIEATDTSTTTVSGQQAYDNPTDCVRIRALLYNGELLQQLSFRDWETTKAAGVTPSGKSIQFVAYNSQVLLIPIPDAAYTLTFYYEKYHPLIEATTDTLEIDGNLLGLYLEGVLADMYGKDLNAQMQTFHEQRWQNNAMPALLWYAKRTKRGSRVKTLLDADSHPITDRGMY